MMKKICGFLVLALLAGALVAPAAVAGKKKKKKNPPARVVIGEDQAGDWGANVDPNIGPVGDALGQDLIKAEINKADKETLEFIISLNALPPSGGAPEVSRYSWSFNVDGEYREFDGKFTNYSRGICDPTSGACPPPRDPGQQPFFLRGNCTTTQNVVTCEEMGVVQASFDAGKGTITIPVTLEMLGAKPGSEITPVPGNLFGGMVEAVPAAFLSSGNFPSDALIGTETYEIPK